MSQCKKIFEQIFKKIKNIIFVEVNKTDAF